MTGIHPSLAEVIRDEDREHVRKELTTLIRHMQNDGRKTRAILRALVDVMMDIAVELPTGNHYYHYWESVRDRAQYVIEHLDAIIEQGKHTRH